MTGFLAIDNQAIWFGVSEFISEVAALFALAWQPLKSVDRSNSYVLY
jgi:hypothetical protein